MIYSSKGIVLQTTAYSESSLIVKMYTEQFGLTSCIVKGARQHKRKVTALFQPLSIVEVEVYQNKNTSLHVVKNVRGIFPFRTIYHDVEKTAILLFLNEVISKSIREEVQNKELFLFFCDTIQTLDQMDEVKGEFHLCFLIHFAEHLGFCPQNNYSPKQAPIFDLQMGSFVLSAPLHPHWMNSEESALFHALLQERNFSLDQSFTYSMRLRLLNHLIRFYELHILNFGTMKSHEVLHEIFR